MKSAEFVAATTRLEDLPRKGKPQVAIVGRSNVGKSSLINHLFQRNDLARVSSTPGRTATVNLYDIGKVYLVDLPGYGFTKERGKRVAFADLIMNYLSETPDLKLVLVVIDAYVGPTDMDTEMFGYLHSLQMPLVIIVNKIDKLSKGQASSLLQSLQ